MRHEEHAQVPVVETEAPSHTSNVTKEARGGPIWTLSPLSPLLPITGTRALPSYVGKWIRFYLPSILKSRYTSNGMLCDIIKRRRGVLLSSLGTEFYDC